jgi:uncharacterized radical SAM superfamily Fe-S cluster-containing enzyme
MQHSIKCQSDESCEVKNLLFDVRNKLSPIMAFVELMGTENVPEDLIEETRQQAIKSYNYIMTNVKGNF